MRHCLITWYTPEEKIPEEKINILFKSNNNYDDSIYSGWFIYGRFDADYPIFEPNEISEWCYIDNN